MTIDDLEVRKKVLGKALCFLRLIRGIQSLRMLGQLYSEQVDPDYSKVHYASQTSRWERGFTTPNTSATLEYLFVVRADLGDFDAALGIMARLDAAGIASLRQASKRSKRLTGYLERLATSRKKTIEEIIDAAQEAQGRE